MVHEYILSKKHSFNVILGTAMIDMYAKCGNVDAAREIFECIKERNVITWSSMISAYGIHGRGGNALELFSQLLESGIRPNRITLFQFCLLVVMQDWLMKGRSSSNYLVTRCETLYLYGRSFWTCWETQ